MQPGCQPGYQPKEDSMKKALLILAAAATLSPLGAGAQALITERSLSLDAAMELATAALAQCRKDGYKVTITVLNRHARTAVVLSDDGANPHTIENSMRKAYTAFTTRSPSVDMGKRPQPGLASFMLLDKITAGEGALPIFAGKELVGSAGISGAPAAKKTPPACRPA